MDRFDIDYARDHLLELIERAANGEAVEIIHPGGGTVRLTPVAIGDHGPPRAPGRWKGRFTVPVRLFEPLSDDELALLSGEQSS